MFLLGVVGCVGPFGFEEQPVLPETDDMVYLEGGAFLMGYPDVTPGPYGNHWKANQQPEHPVEVSSFYMDETEVTVADWALFLNALYEVSPSSAAVHYFPMQPIVFEGDFIPKSGQDTTAMHYVSWFDCRILCGAGNVSQPKQSGSGLHLALETTNERFRGLRLGDRTAGVRCTTPTIPCVRCARSLLGVVVLKGIPQRG